jgi:hypothetical protein
MPFGDAPRRDFADFDSFGSANADLSDESNLTLVARPSSTWPVDDRGRR